VNLGGEPERDDFGLPPVDIEIPDDARELDRDVQAYHRELRAERRRLRAGRLRGPLTRDGMVLPLLAGCLVLALISGTLLTLFSSGQADAPGSPNRVSAGPAKTAHGTTPGKAAAGNAAAVGKVDGPLPNKTLVIAGAATRLDALPPAVLALVPLGCRCAKALQELVRQAATAKVQLYFVGNGSGMAQLPRLASMAGQPAAYLADDVHNVLGNTYRPVGLTAILVHAGGLVAQVARGLQPGLKLTPQFQQLSPSRGPGT
jgi:hypothetical protein